MTALRFLLVLVPAVALAQPRSDTETAGKYTAAGLAAQEKGDYEAALAFYENAYELVQHPVLLFNMGQANRLAGRDERALELYRRYLAEEPNGAHAKLAREHVTALEPRIAAATAEQAKRDAEAAAAAATTARLELERAAATRTEAERARTVTPVAPVPHDAPVEHAGRTLRLTGLGLAGGGVLGLAVGAYFGLRARSLSDEVSARYDLEKIDEGERAERIAIVGFVGGGVLLGAGAVLYWRGRVAGKRAREVAISPVVSPVLSGLSVSGAF